MRCSSARLCSLVLCCVVALLGVWGCAGPAHTIDAAAIDNSLQAVCSRHDAYVNADSALSADEKRIYLRTTELLVRLQNTAMGRTNAPPPSTVPPAVTTTGPPR